MAEPLGACARHRLGALSVCLLRPAAAAIVRFLPHVCDPVFLYQHLLNASELRYAACDVLHISLVVTDHHHPPKGTRWVEFSMPHRFPLFLCAAARHAPVQYCLS